MQIPILSGIFASPDTADFRVAYPRNLTPVVKPQGISQGYLRPADGVRQVATGPGNGRGGINWKGVLYRVSGTKLVKVSEDGVVTECGDVGIGGPVSMDYGNDQLAIASGGRLYYWNGAVLTHVTDPDLGLVKTVKFIGGYFMTNDGTYIVVTELNDPTSVNPLKYGSSEADPDPIMANDEFRGEAYAFNRYSIEVFQNVGGSNFPFAVVKGAQVSKGIVGPLAVTFLGNTFAFVGSGRNEAPGIYTMALGDAAKISTSEIDQILAAYSEDELATVVVESRVDQNQQWVLVHLPDSCLAFDTVGSKLVGELVWHTLDSGAGSPSTYRARGLVWCYGRWNVDDPTSNAIGVLDPSVSTHYGQSIGWECSTLAVYNAGNDAIVHELELVTLPGRIALGAEPVVWSSYTKDGITWSQERPKSCGEQGQTTKRLAWRTQGTIGQWRVQRFRGTSDAHIGLVRLEAQLEPLMTRPVGG